MNPTVLFLVASLANGLSQLGTSIFLTIRDVRRVSDQGGPTPGDWDRLEQRREAAISEIDRLTETS